MSFPLSPDDLREVADTIEKLTEVLFDANGEWALPENIGEFSIPLNRPGNYGHTDIIGYAVIDDGQIGFSFTDPHNKIGFNSSPGVSIE